MQSNFTGTIHGRIIELETDALLPDGAKVRISLEAIESSSRSEQARAAIIESGGAWSDADDVEFGRWQEFNDATRCASHRDEFMDVDAQR